MNSRKGCVPSSSAYFRQERQRSGGSSLVRLGLLTTSLPSAFIAYHSPSLESIFPMSHATSNAVAAAVLLRCVQIEPDAARPETESSISHLMTLLDVSNHDLQKMPLTTVSFEEPREVLAILLFLASVHIPRISIPQLCNELLSVRHENGFGLKLALASQEVGKLQELSLNLRDRADQGQHEQHRTDVSAESRIVADLGWMASTLYTHTLSTLHTLEQGATKTFSTSFLTPSEIMDRVNHSITQMHLLDPRQFPPSFKNGYVLPKDSSQSERKDLETFRFWAEEWLQSAHASSSLVIIELLYLQIVFQRILFQKVKPIDSDTFFKNLGSEIRTVRNRIYACRLVHKCGVEEEAASACLERAIMKHADLAQGQPFATRLAATTGTDVVQAEAEIFSLFRTALDKGTGRYRKRAIKVAVRSPFGLSLLLWIREAMHLQSLIVKKDRRSKYDDHARQELLREMEKIAVQFALVLRSSAAQSNATTPVEKHFFGVLKTTLDAVARCLDPHMAKIFEQHYAQPDLPAAHLDGLLDTLLRDAASKRARTADVISRRLQKLRAKAETPTHANFIDLTNPRVTTFFEKSAAVVTSLCVRHDISGEMAKHLSFAVILSICRKEFQESLATSTVMAQRAANSDKMPAWLRVGGHDLPPRALRLRLGIITDSTVYPAGADLVGL